MFYDIIAELFAGCTNPIEYVTVFLLFYMCIELVVRIINALVSNTRRF